MIFRYLYSLYFVSLLLSAVVLIACGEDTETVRVTDRYTLDMLGKGVSLTEETCDSARLGQLLYVGDSSSIYYCTGKAWKKVNGKDGKDGRDGKDGEDGVDGQKGKYGTSGTDCFVEEFADGIVLGCGATKAIVRYDFEIPDTCSIRLNTDSSYVLNCGDESATLLQGARGVQGAPCVQKDMGDGRVNLVCGGDSVTLFRAACGETPFDPDGSLFCYGDSLVERCNMHIYDIKKQFCYGDTLVDLCGGNAYELKERFCYRDSLIAFCGGKSYDPKEDFCSNDSMVTLCGGKPFDVSGQFCYGDTIVALCGGEDYDLALQFCYSDSLVNLCGGKSYGLKNQFCYNDSLINLCGGKTYDIKEKFCLGTSLYDFCGGKSYFPTQKFCYNDSLVDLCGGKAYDIKEKFCYNSSLYDFCGGEKYAPTKKFCYNDSLVDLCGGKEYELTQQFCFAGLLLDLCGGEEYDLNLQFCRRDSIVDLCAGRTYDLDVQFCHNDSLVDLCGVEKYNPEQQFCFNGTLIDLCGTESYDPNELFCKNGELGKECRGYFYRVKSEFCDDRNGAIYRYTVIGGVTWMAQNLDYRVPQSFCDSVHKDSDLRCGIKGRFYPWNVAMEKEWDECGSGHRCGNRIYYPHQGVCPDGWHIPTIEEWAVLIDVMGPYDIAYWDDTVLVRGHYGSNEFGFSAIPTGIVNVEWDGDTFVRTSKFGNGNDGNSPIWTDGFDTWSSTEADADKAELFYFYANDSYSGQVHIDHPYSKESTRTIRCVKNRG